MCHVHCQRAAHTHSLWGLMFPIEQIVRAMVEDGLLAVLQQQQSTNKNAAGLAKPIYGLLCAAVLSSLFAGLFTIGHLIDLLSIGTLLAFIVMAIAIVMLRYVYVCVCIYTYMFVLLHRKELLFYSVTEKKLFKNVIIFH